MRCKSGYDPEAAGALCSVCPLQEQRVVPPEGSPDAPIAYVGEAPGALEEKAGKPFVGPSGIEFADLLRGAGFERKSVFITNAILCRTDVPGIKGKKRYDVPTYLAWIKVENKKRAKAAKAAGQPSYLHIPDPFDCCKPRLWGELLYLEARAVARGQPNGLVVQPMGNYAALAIVGKRGIMKLRGSPIKLTLPSQVAA
jgi:hypothetical protein